MDTDFPDEFVLAELMRTNARIIASTPSKTATKRKIFDAAVPAGAVEAEPVGGGLIALVATETSCVWSTALRRAEIRER
jgi:hypothetical protein